MKKAFTLIELVVVIAIIAVLSVVGMVSFSGINTKSRDTRRIQDIQKIAAALEMVRQVGKTYPTDAGWTAALVPNYLQIMPTDPKTKTNYVYDQVSSYKYTLTATLEDARNNPNQASTTYILNSP